MFDYYSIDSLIICVQIERGCPKTIVSLSLAKVDNLIVNICQYNQTDFEPASFHEGPDLLLLYNVHS